MAKNEQFSSRWGIILASLGMAVGAGNIWRFPRLAGQYGGTFLILWMVFLFVWSIPILMAEFAIGKKIKKSVIGSFAGVAGKRYTWMGFFIALCTLGITFYYSVITAWALQYLGFALENLFNNLAGNPTVADRLGSGLLQNHWQQVSSDNPLTLVLHFVALVGAAVLLYKGVQNGLEKANRVLIPSLFLMLLLMAGMTISTEGGLKGLEYLFTIRTELFAEPGVWIEALTQSAWSTGAGWGLIMTISSYSRKKEDVTLNTFISGFGNNTASLVAAMAVLPAVFMLAGSSQEAINFLQAGNQSLTFIIIPELFTRIPGGYVLSVIFFVAFFLAAFTSLLPMLELLIHLIKDLGFERHKATIQAAILCFALGAPSAWSLQVFSNQDWVWGVGLIISGMFICFAALKSGPAEFKKRLIDQDSDFRVPDLYFRGAIVLNIGLALFLIWWWLSQGYSEYPWFNARGQWNLLDTYSNATVITQWAVILLSGLLLNNILYKKYHSQ